MKRVSMYVLLLLVIMALCASCEEAPLNAPSDSSIRLYANPSEIDVDSGVSVITAFVTEADGTYVPDGTVVYFSTTLGQLDFSEMETSNGTCINYLRAGGRRGEASVVATSGSTASAEVQIAIGGTVGQIILTAQPDTIEHGATSVIICTILDSYGNPISNQPVIITATNGATLQSGSQVQYTNNSGQVLDILTSSPEYHDIQITVTAYSGDQSETITITVD